MKKIFYDSTLAGVLLFSVLAIRLRLALLFAVS